MAAAYSDVGIVDVILGSDVRIVRPANVYGCRIGDRTFIGPFCEIQRNVIIGMDSASSRIALYVKW